MVSVEVVEFDTETHVTAAAGNLIWRASEDGLTGHRPEDGASVAETGTFSVTELGGSADILVAQLASGDLVGFAPDRGEELFRGWSEPGSRLLGDAGGVWVYEPGSGQARRVTIEGPAPQPVAVGPARVLAVGRDELWSVTDVSHIASTGGSRFDLDTPSTGDVAIVCSGSLWLGGNGQLDRVSLWSGEQGNPLPVPVGDILVLTCLGGRVIGADSSWPFVLDPAVDAGATRVESALSGPPVAAAGVREVAWVVTAHDAVVMKF